MYEEDATTTLTPLASFLLSNPTLAELVLVVGSESEETETGIFEVAVFTGEVVGASLAFFSFSSTDSSKSPAISFSISKLMTFPAASNLLAGLSFRAGSIFNAEVISTVDINDDTVFPRIRLYREDRRDKTLTLVAENDDEFESFDSFLLDAEINSTGVYVIEIDAPDTVQTDIDGDGIDDTVDFSLFGEETELALRRGKYTLNAYQVTGR